MIIKEFLKKETDENSVDLKEETNALMSRRFVVFEKIIKNTEEYLDKTHPGLLPRLDWHFYQRYRESFVKHLLLKPEETINELLNYYGVDSFDKADTAKYIVYVVLKCFFMNNPVYFEEAFNCIKRFDWIKLRRLINKYIDSLV